MDRRCPYLDSALALLRGRRSGALVYDGTPLPSRFVLDNDTGRPVLPVPHAVMDAEEHVLFIPDEGEGALQLLAIPEVIDAATSDAPDRWTAHHGAARLPLWVRFAIDCARIGGHVLDGADLAIANTLAAAEPALCKRLNADRARLARLAAGFLGVQPDEALAVGVDQFGVDVRTRLDVVRAPFPATAIDAAAAEAMLDALLAGAGEAP